MKIANLSCFLVLASGAFGQTGTISAAIEPALNTGHFGGSAAVALDLSSESSVSLRAGTGKTVLAGFNSEIVRLTAGDLQFRIHGDLQAGMIGGRAGISTGLYVPVWSIGKYAVSIGAHLVKAGGVSVYPTVYASVARSWGK
jgi:hypothetical protein